MWWSLCGKCAVTKTEGHFEPWGRKTDPSNWVWWIHSCSVYSHIHSLTHTVKNKLAKTLFDFFPSHCKSFLLFISLSLYLSLPFNFILLVLPLSISLSSALLCFISCIKIPPHSSLLPPTSTPSIFWKQEWYTGFKLNSLSVSLIAC